MVHGFGSTGLSIRRISILGRDTLSHVFMKPPVGSFRIFISAGIVSRVAWLQVEEHRSWTLEQDLGE